MDVNKIPETKASREFRLWAHQRGLIEDRRSALLALLSARGLAPSAQEREQIEAFEDADALLECIQYAAAATTVPEALTPLGRGRPPAPQPRRARSTRASTEKPERSRR